MFFSRIRKNWPAHLVPLGYAVLAAAMLILTPFWASAWYHTPFLGMLLEPNNVVSEINGVGWPARQSGVLWSDRLMSINNQAVQDTAQVNGLMQANGFQAVTATFLRRGVGEMSQQIQPVHVQFRDLLSLFLAPYLVGLTFLGIGLWTYRIRPELHSTHAFVIFVSAVSVITTTFLDMNTSHHALILWSLSLPLSAAALGYLALVFPMEMKFVERWPRLRYIPFLVALLADVFIAHDILFPSNAYAYIASWRTGYALNVIGAFSFFGTLVARMLGKSSAIVRQQSRVIIFGSTLAFLPILVLYLIPIGFGGSIPEFRPELLFPPLVFFPLSVMYAILRYRLLDVDRWLSRALTYVLTMGVALTVFYALLAGLSLLLSQTIHSDDPFLVAGYLLVLVIAFQPLRDSIQRGIDRVFYRSHADYRRVITRLSQSLVITPDLTRTLRLLEEELGDALLPEKFVVFLYDDERKAYLPHAIHSDVDFFFTPEEPLPRFLSETKIPLWIPPEEILPTALEADATSFARLECSTFVPLLYEGRLIGFLALGRRRSGEPYTSNDLEFLTAVAGQSTLALENARLFENLRRTLEETREMKNLMDDIFASIATGIITTDVDQKITLFNRAAETIMGTPLQLLIGKSLREAFPGLLPALEEVTAVVIQSGEIAQNQELASHIPSRGDLYLRLSATPLRDAYLATKGATLVFEDLTETRQLEAERERIRQTFGRVVAPRVRDRLLSDASNLQLDGSQQLVTILFADLNGFTSFSEKHSPETVFNRLNAYFDMAAQAILEQEGTLDKFIGDAVMALWNSPDSQPDHALRACRAALAIMKYNAEANGKVTNPEDQLVFRIGVSTGPAIVGNVGTRQLFNYTAIGDTVNLSQRLQTAARRGQILITKATYQIVKDSVRAQPLKAISVKGREQSVDVYALQGLK